MAPVAPNVIPGTYFALATITDVDGHTRYAYASTAITIEGQSSNTPPVAADDSYTVARAATLIADDADGSLGDASQYGVLVNDSDPEGQPITAVLFSGASHGTLTLQADGTFEYIHGGGTATTDQFAYRAFDGDSYSPVATVTITIIPDVVDDRAQNETSIRGTIVAGDYTSTYENDGNFELLREAQQSTGKPANRRSFLEHQWSFMVTGGSTVQFFIDAHREGGEDAFRFEYQDPTTGTWLALTTITETSDDDQYRVVDLPSQLAGPLEIRVVDTLSEKNESQDSLYIDDMFIRSMTGSPPPWLSIGDSSVQEGDTGTVTTSFTVTRGGDLDQLVTVDYRTVVGAGSASAEADYIPISSQTLSFSPGISSATLEVAVIGDLEFEEDENFFVELFGESDGVTMARRLGEGVIENDDAPPAGATKFYVVDSGVDQSFEYGEDGASLPATWQLDGSNRNPRGATANADGTSIWVVDSSDMVFVYDPDGGLIGSWSADGLNRAEGIATDSTDIWILDGKNDQVLHFANAAALTAGTASPNQVYDLAAANSSAKGITTDGTYIWVVDDGRKTDQVFRYDLATWQVTGWTLNTANARPSGLTIDPQTVNGLWIVDSASDAMFFYASGKTGNLNTADAVYPLAAANTDPQGIADPPVTMSVVAQRNPIPVGWIGEPWAYGMADAMPVRELDQDNVRGVGDPRSVAEHSGFTDARDLFFRALSQENNGNPMHFATLHDGTDSDDGLSDLLTQLAMDDVEAIGVGSVL